MHLAIVHAGHEIKSMQATELRVLLFMYSADFEVCEHTCMPQSNFTSAFVTISDTIVFVVL